jgi:hypothetical protein
MNQPVGKKSRRFLKNGKILRTKTLNEYSGIYSFKKGREVIRARFASELQEIEQIIKSIDSAQYRTKVSKEKTMQGALLYDPRSLNAAYKGAFEAQNWKRHRIHCDYSEEEYVPGYKSAATAKGAFREIDFVKNRAGVEVQFGKYAFMVYNVCAKMTIFRNLDVIDVGVEIVPMKDFANLMSTGISYFEQIVWDLKTRGEADIDIPVLILGVTS